MAQKIQFLNNYQTTITDFGKLRKERRMFLFVSVIFCEHASCVRKIVAKQSLREIVGLQ